MLKSNRVLQLTAFGMIIVGFFSIITGFLSTFGYSDMINDYIGNRELFHFINGGIYFVVCGIIHILVSILALYKIKTKQSKLICIIIGVFTLAWQLAAFVYLLTLSFFSLRAGLMVIFPIVYLTAAISSVVKERISLTDEKGDALSRNQRISTPKNFFEFNFSFKRKNIDDLFRLNGKRHTKKISVSGLFNRRLSGKRHNVKFMHKPRRTFKSKRR
ncbi:MAG: hypothetical protein Q4G33_10870 [bacterium]|nr:hypothetical protein [bacterium]